MISHIQKFVRPQASKIVIAYRNFLAVQDSSISDIVGLSLGRSQLTIRDF